MGKNERHGNRGRGGLRLRTYRRQHDDRRRVAGKPADREALPGLQITRSDYFDLGRLTASGRTPALSHVVAFLERELARAEIVDDALVRTDVATLRSHLAFHDEATRRDWAVTLGHPSDVASRDDAISVMSPLGAALIGLSEGQSIAFSTADGRDRRVTLVKVFAQPRVSRGSSRSAGGLAMTSDEEIGDERE